MNKVLWIVLIVAGLAAPWLVYPVFAMKLLCFALFACAFNLLLGYTGLLSFGHAAFFGGAAYLAGHTIKVWQLSPLAGIIVGTVFAGVLGLAFGALAIRRHGIYFAMVTLALAQIVYFLALQLPFTGGENGLQGIPRGHLFGVIDLNDSITMYFFVFAIFLLGFGATYRIVNSPFGKVLTAIRENEDRARSLGYEVERYKLIVFTLSAALAGTAGATKAVVFQFASLTDVHWQMSGAVILMTLLGGMGTLFGPVVGAIIVIALQTQLSGVGSWIEVCIGAIFVVCVLVFRQGVIGALQQRFGPTARRRYAGSGE